MNLRKAAQQALEALEYENSWHAPRNEKPYFSTLDAITALRAALAEHEQEPVAMRMPKVGDKVICLEDESLGTVVSLTSGGSPDIVFDDGTHGTYLLREFAELFSYVTTSKRTTEQEPVAWAHKGPLGYSFSHVRNEAFSIPLYTAPPQRKPLTEEEVTRLIYENTKINPNVADDRELLGYIVNAARAIEHAHGIGEKHE